MRAGRQTIQAFTNWTSRVMVTSSPTRMLPVSSVAFQVRPKSLRLIFVVAESPRRVLPQGSLAGGVGHSTVNTTLRVTSRMVRSPVTANSPLPERAMRVDLNHRPRPYQARVSTPRGLDVRRAANCLGFHELYIEGDGYFVAD